MKQTTENQDNLVGGINDWKPLIRWTVGALSLTLLMPAVLVFGYFVAALCLIAVPLSGLGLLLAYFASSKPHIRWSTTFILVDEIQPNVLNLEQYVRENRCDQDIFLAS